MSGSRHGGRDAAVREYDTGEPIRGRIVYADGTHSAFTCSRLVNGAEREVAHVEVDGEVFAPADGGRIAELEELCELFYGENDFGDDGWWCRSCGGWFAASFRHTGCNNIIEPRYCPNCGRRAKGEL